MISMHVEKQCREVSSFLLFSSEINAYLKHIKVILPTVVKISYFFTSDECDRYFYTVANRDCFHN